MEKVEELITDNQGSLPKVATAELTWLLGELK